MGLSSMSDLTHQEFIDRTTCLQPQTANSDKNAQIKIPFPTIHDNKSNDKNLSAPLSIDWRDEVKRHKVY